MFRLYCDKFDDCSNLYIKKQKPTFLKSYLVFKNLVLNSGNEEFRCKNRIKILTSPYLQPEYLPNSESIDLIQTF